jgi:hypothetical protein
MIREQSNYIHPTSSGNNKPGTPGKYIDMKQIKKIEPKRTDKQSTKQVNKTIEYVKTDNLNAKTAEILRNSPNNIVNAKPLMAVNINNSNKVYRDEISNYEKALFKPNNTHHQNQRQGNITPVVATTNRVYRSNLEKESQSNRE